jgi:hypothetical protein
MLQGIGGYRPSYLSFRFVLTFSLLLIAHGIKVLAIFCVFDKIWNPFTVPLTET